MTDRATVLLVDDDPNIQSMFEMALDYHDISLTVTIDRPTALKFLSEVVPDIIVLDIFLPGTDGYKLLQELRTLPGLADCPVIATTAYYTTDSVSDIQKAGFDGYLLKPLDPEEMVNYLMSFLS